MTDYCYGRRTSVWKRILAQGGWGQRTTGSLPEATEAEERANSITGGIGLTASLVGFVLLLAHPVGDLSYRIGAAVYGLTLVLCFAVNTLYHAELHRPLKERLRVLDHCAVYALIAGTYTPVALAGLGGRLGWAVLAAAWLLAGVGILFKLNCRFRYPGTSIVVYLLMGWLAFPVMPRLLNAVGAEGLLLLVAGGVAYTIGTIFFGAKRMRHHHAVWHVLVLIGSACHYVAIVRYVLPLTG